MVTRRKREPLKRKTKGTPRKTDRSIQFFFVWGMIIIYVIVFSYLSIYRYRSYQTSAYDLGTMIQVIWNTSKGWFLQDSINMGYPMSRFWMAHWEFIFILVAAIFKVFPHVYTILILQTIVVALGALPLYWIGKLITHDKSTAATFSFAYLMYPAIQNANLADVHGVTFAATFLLFAFYYLMKRDLKRFYLFAALSLMCREDLALLLIALAIYMIFVMKEKKHGLIVATVSVVWFLIWFQRLKIHAILGLPAFDIMAGADTHWSHLKQLTHDPLYLFKFWAKKYNILYFIYIFAPVVFLSFLGWRVLLIATPIFLINLISSYYYTHDVEHYYSVTVAPFVFISAIFGLQKLSDWFVDKLGHRFKERSIRENVLSIAATLVLVIAIVLFFVKSNAMDYRQWNITPHHRVIDQIIATIPQEASVTAEHGLVPQVAMRHEIYVFNDNISKVDYILYDFYSPSVRLVTRSSFHVPYYWPDNDSIRAVIRNPNYGIVRYEDGVCLWRRGADYNTGIRELAIDVGAAIETFSKKEITPPIEFMGYNQFPLLKAYHPIEGSEAIRWSYAIHFTAFWSISQRLNQDLPIIFRFQSGNQTYYLTHAPVFGVFPTTYWQPGEIVKDEIFWELPEMAQSGLYQISAAFADEAVDQFESLPFVKLFELNVEIPKEQ
ncbi:MAG: DUF2079 domain-containing protein [candidate division KSB1 bacterium]|nr:DUF2079 domain-containing protein [candidate division KSB1 bacterium]